MIFLTLLYHRHSRWDEDLVALCICNLVSAPIIPLNCSLKFDDDPLTVKPNSSHRHHSTWLLSSIWFCWPKLSPWTSLLFREHQLCWLYLLSRSCSLASCSTPLMKMRPKILSLVLFFLLQIFFFIQQIFVEFLLCARQGSYLTLSMQMASR